MNLVTHTFEAGVPRTFPMTGRYFRLLGGAGDFKVTARHYEGGAISTEIIAGIGIDLSNPDTGKPYKEIEITAASAQSVRFLSSYFPSSDSRLTGDVDINGLLSVVNNGGSMRNSGVITVPGAGAIQLRATDLNRLKCAFHFPIDVWLGKDNTVTNLNGFPLLGGSKLVDENTAEIFAYFGAACSVPFIEDLK